MKKDNLPNYPQLIKQLFISSRPVSWINTAFPFAAAYLFTGGSIGVSFFAATLYFLIPYNVLIYVVNDVFDYESDKRNPRKNSIEGGLLPPETHNFMLLATAGINLPFLVYLFAIGSVTTNQLLALIVLGAVSYSVPPLRLKERPVLDSMNSSFHFVSPLIFAMVLTGFAPVYWWYIAAFFAWGCASHAFGAVQDINADRAASISSIATWLGAKKTVRLSLILYLLAIGLVISRGWPALLVGLPLVGYPAMVVPFVNLTDKVSERANRGWRKFLLLNQLTGFVVTLLLLASRLL